MSPKNSPLRIAILCRVSTEKQGDGRKVSLALQEKQTKAAVDSLGGTITKEYKGTQHATPGYEKAMVDRLLEDAQRKRKPFDAVMVAEPSRWSRDNAASATGLEVLRGKGIRFFCGSTEYDLFDPTATFLLAQFATINQYLASTQKQKAVRAKIEYAKQGSPSCGTIPHGRTYDETTGKWGVDEAKKRIVQDAAKRYLAGETLKALAAEYGIGRTSLHGLLRNHCGPIFLQRFNVPDLNIKETVETQVPALLTAKTIKAVQRKMDRQRTGGGAGNNRHQYLLGGYVRCAVCGLCLSPQGNGAHRYYRHSADCIHLDGGVRADDLERVVASQLVELMGNPAAVARAAQAHQVALGNVEEQRTKVDHLERELAKVAKSQKRTVGLLDDDLVDESVIREKLAKLRERQHKLEEERDHLAEQIATAPTPEDVERAAKRAKRRLQNAKGKSYNATKAEDLPRADLIALIAETFADTTHANGKWPGGIYITNLPQYKGKRPRRWAYEIHGNLPYKGAYHGVKYGHTDMPPEAFEDDGDDYVNEANAS